MEGLRDLLELIQLENDNAKTQLVQRQTWLLLLGPQSGFMSEDFSWSLAHLSQGAPCPARHSQTLANLSPCYFPHQAGSLSMASLICLCTSNI